VRRYDIENEAERRDERKGPVCPENFQPLILAKAIIELNADEERKDHTEDEIHNELCLDRCE
jgi:hypothetical protein